MIKHEKKTDEERTQLLRIFKYVLNNRNEDDTSVLLQMGSVLMRVWWY